ncbi:MAG: ABC transporter ATP-binding protein [Pseudomonadota bacterium]
MSERWTERWFGTRPRGWLAPVGPRRAATTDTTDTRGDTGSAGAENSARQRFPAAFAGRLTFEGICRDFGDHAVLKDVSFEAQAGELVCLLGPSGCGKTTLLRIASGVDRPTRGRVMIDGTEVAGPAVDVAPERRNVGLMFQDFALFPHLTIVENVAFGLNALKRAEARAEAMTLLDRVGVAHHADDYPSVLSGGQQQRVALARAIAPRPAVLLMDEPFSGLDVHLRKTMQTQTRGLLKESRATSVMVTHDPAEAMRMGDRIAVLHDGRLSQFGTAEDLYSQPADLFVARLFSEINELPTDVSDGMVQTPFGRFPAAGVRSGERAILCIRKRAVRISADPAAGVGLHGRVLAKSFRGDLAELEIGVADIDQRLNAVVRDRNVAGPGTEVRVTLDPDGVLVFPAAATGASAA